VAEQISPPRPRRRNASDRILQGAIARVIEVGAAELSLHDVAMHAGVSKALIHYHFADKESLLVQVVKWGTAQIVARESEILRDTTPTHAVDALWQWLAEELERGHLRALLGLTQYRAPKVQNAVRESVETRCAAMAVTIRRLFSVLELRPRVPTEPLASVVVAFGDGLAARPAGERIADARVAFDIFWLAILSLAE
jgi:AcrR family transcriptional regulator